MLHRACTAEEKSQQAEERLKEALDDLEKVRYVIILMEFQKVYTFLIKKMKLLSILIFSVYLLLITSNQRTKIWVLCLCLDVGKS